MHELKLDINQFEKWVIQKSIRGEKDYSYLENMQQWIKSLIVYEDVIIFYPKNLFNEKETQIYLFKNRKLIVVGYQKDSLKMQTYDLDKTERMIVKGKISGFEGIQLTVSFKDNDDIIFDSKLDSNDGWHGNYRDHIIKIMKLLI